MGYIDDERKRIEAAKSALEGIPFLVSEHVPPGKAYMFGDTMLLRPETVAAIVDTSWRARLKRAWYYLRRAWRELWPGMRSA